LRKSLARVGAVAIAIATAVALIAPASAAAADQAQPDIASPKETLLTYFPQSRDAIDAANGDIDAPVSDVDASTNGESFAVVPMPNGVVPSVDAGSRSTTESKGPTVEPIKIGIAEDLIAVAGTNGIDAYVNANSSFAQYTLPSELGLQIINIAAERPASNSVEFPIALVDGGETEALIEDDGSVTVSNADGLAIGAIAPPWAQDANGADIPTEFMIENDVLVQWVDYDTPGIEYPVFSDPDWTYFLEWDLGPIPDITARDVRAEFYDCFSCVFAADPLLTGAPTAFPAIGQVVPLVLGGIGNFTVRMDETVYYAGSTGPGTTGGDSVFWFQFRAEPGHVDGVNSRISFNWSKYWHDETWDNPYMSQYVEARIWNDFPLGNGTYVAAASRTWTYIANTLSLFILGTPPGPPPTGGTS
jgi:hypothetical protein